MPYALPAVRQIIAENAVTFRDAYLMRGIRGSKAAKIIPEITDNASKHFQVYKQLSLPQISIRTPVIRL